MDQPSVSVSEYFTHAGEPDVPHFEDAREILKIGVPDFQKRILPHIQKVNFPPSRTGGFAPLVGGVGDRYQLLLDIHTDIDIPRESTDGDDAVKPGSRRYPFHGRYLLTAELPSQAQLKKFISLFRRESADFIRKNSELMWS